MLNDKANPASEITDLRSRIVTLESDNAALTNERDEALRVTFDVRVIEQLAAAQATNERLREALEHVHDLLGDYGGHSCFAADAPAIPNDTTALDARLRQAKVVVLREAAEKIDSTFINNHSTATNELRRLADEIEKGE